MTTQAALIANNSSFILGALQPSAVPPIETPAAVVNSAGLASACINKSLDAKK